MMMLIDHKKNLLFLEQEQYLEEYFDIDENKLSYGITESGIKALIVWNKIHGLEDPIGITMSYSNPISEDEMQIIFSQFVKKRLITKIWNPKLQSEDYPPSKMGQAVFESLKFFINKKLQKNVERKETAKKIFSSVMTGLVNVTKKMAESSAPDEPNKKRKRKRKRKQRGQQK